MKNKNWTVAFLSAFRNEGSPRVMSQRDLFQLVTHYRGSSSVSKLQQIKKELISINVLFEVTENVLLNMVCVPQTCYAEAAHLIQPASFVSSTTILISAGVINDTGDYIVTSVFPESLSQPLNNLTVEGNGAGYVFHLLPKKFFSPSFPFNDDVVDRRNSYPCFTAEKALLDYLYIGKYTYPYIQQHTNFLLSRLNMNRLISLANTLGLSFLLKEFLDDQSKSLPRNQ